MLQNQILDYLQANCQGRTNARSKSRIMNELNISDERIFRTIIHRLRLEEIPVLSRSKYPYGYYIAVTEQEAAEALRELNSRALDLHRTCKYIKRGLKVQFPGPQLEFNLLNKKEIQNDSFNQRTRT